MGTYIIGFRQKGNPNGVVIREQTVEADNAHEALNQTYPDRVARSETWKVISKRIEGNHFEIITTIDQYRALHHIDLFKV